MIDSRQDPVLLCRTLKALRIIIVFLSLLLGGLAVSRIFQLESIAAQNNQKILYTIEAQSILVNKINQCGSMSCISLADLSIYKTASQIEAADSIIVTYTIVLHNDGPKLASNVIVSDTLSSEMVNASYLVNNSKVDLPAGEFYRWEINELAANQSLTILLAGEFLSPTTSITNTVEIQGNVADVNQENNLSLAVISPEYTYSEYFIEGNVWYDKNRNGQQDEIGKGVPGIQVQLFSQNFGLLDAFTVFTNEYGYFEIANITEGVYSLQFNLNGPYVFTAPNTGDEGNDSDVNSEGYSDFFVIDQTNTHLSMDAGIYSPNLFLPIILSPLPNNPDLAIVDISIINNDFVVTIKNLGITSVEQLEFWVHGYINPEEVPQKVNQLCIGSTPMKCDGWITWFVTSTALPIAPGETLDLSLRGVNNSYALPALSSLPQRILVGTKIYAQVDAANAGNSFGNIIEIDELLRQTYNNIKCVQTVLNPQGHLVTEPCSK